MPFLARIKNNFGITLALVHDMGKGILAFDDPDLVNNKHASPSTLTTRISSHERPYNRLRIPGM